MGIRFRLITDSTERIYTDSQAVQVMGIFQPVMVAKPQEIFNFIGAVLFPNPSEVLLVEIVTMTRDFEKIEG